MHRIIRSLLVLAGAAAATSAWSDQDMSAALVQLNGDPLATYAKTKPAQGKKIDFNSNTVKSYRTQLSALRNDYKAWLRANAPRMLCPSTLSYSTSHLPVSRFTRSMRPVL